MKTKLFARSLIVALIILLAFIHQGVQQVRAESTVIFSPPGNLQVIVDTGEYASFNWRDCNGTWNTGGGYPEGPFTHNIDDLNGIKEYYVHVYPRSGQLIEIENTNTGVCRGEEISKASSYCSNFTIANRVPQSPAIPISFKGPGNITSANITFKDLGYSLSIWLHHYDWGSGIWYGYLNTTYLPLGKHHGHVTTFVDGVRGGGCATGGFKVVDE